MIMYLNGKENEPIEISAYTRDVEFAPGNLLYRLNINFYGNYNSTGIEILTNYVHTTITAIKIIDNDTIRMNITNANIKLQSLSESCDADGCVAFAIMNAYAPEV